MPTLPEKDFFNYLDAHVVDKRRKALEEYMTRIVQRLPTVSKLGLSVNSSSTYWPLTNLSVNDLTKLLWTICVSAICQKVCFFIELFLRNCWEFLPDTMCHKFLFIDTHYLPVHIPARVRAYPYLCESVTDNPLPIIYFSYFYASATKWTKIVWTLYEWLASTYLVS